MGENGAGVAGRCGRCMPGCRRMLGCHSQLLNMPCCSVPTVPIAVLGIRVLLNKVIPCRRINSGAEEV